jgi:hypothetical protein
MRLTSINLLIIFLILTCFLLPTQSHSFFVAIDPNALNLDSHSAHEELTRQAYEYLQNKWKAEGTDHRSYLEDELDSLYNITRGVYATDIPNGNHVISLPQFWQYPTDVMKWHRNPFGQHLHALRNRKLDEIQLESARDACMGTKKDLMNVLSQAFDNLTKDRKSEFLFLVGHGLHIIQDSFSTVHTKRQDSGNYNLIDLCYSGNRPDNEKACYHKDNDNRDHIWLTQDLAGLASLTKKEWGPRGEPVKSIGSFDSFVLSNTSDNDKKAYLKHEARLAKAASIQYLKITLDLVLRFPKDTVKDETIKNNYKKQFVDKIFYLLDGDGNNNGIRNNGKNNGNGKVDSYDQIMSQGIMNCSELKK